MSSPDLPPGRNRRQLTINAAGLLLLFGWACYTLVTWLVYRHVPNPQATAALVAEIYLLAVGGLLANMAIQSLRTGRHLTYTRAIDRVHSPRTFWLLTSALGGVGVALIAAGLFALIFL